MNDIPTSLTVACYIVMFLYGIVIGSFVNVCICRIPRKESIVKVRSHCENCGYTLKWYDLIPVFSYLCLGGKCRKCGKKISVWHLLMEVSNGVLYVLVFFVCGFSGTSNHLRIFLSLSIFSTQLGIDISAKFGQDRIRLPSRSIAIPSGVQQQSSGNSVNSFDVCI